jgi:hypothetical protein
MSIELLGVEEISTQLELLELSKGGNRASLVEQWSGLPESQKIPLIDLYQIIPEDVFLSLGGEVVNFFRTVASSQLDYQSDYQILLQESHRLEKKLMDSEKLVWNGSGKQTQPMLASRATRNLVSLALSVNGETTSN